MQSRVINSTIHQSKQHHLKGKLSQTSQVLGVLNNHSIFVQHSLIALRVWISFEQRVMLQCMMAGRDSIWDFESEEEAIGGGRAA